MHSNYNELTLPMSADGIFNPGDIYKVPERTAWDNWRHYRFDGLKVLRVDYCFGIRLHFDWNDWQMNQPKLPVRNINKKITYK